MMALALVPAEDPSPLEFPCYFPARFRGSDAGSMKQVSVALVPFASLPFPPLLFLTLFLYPQPVLSCGGKTAKGEVTQLQACVDGGSSELPVSPHLFYPAASGGR